METFLHTFLQMPMPMATALLIMVAIAAFLFVKLLALLLMPVTPSEHLLVIRQARSAQPATTSRMARPAVERPATPAKVEATAKARRTPRRDDHGRFVSAC